MKFAILGLAIQIIGWISMLAFARRKAPPLDPSLPLPGVTLLKPCMKNEDGELENFRTFFEQNYDGPLEILFIVSRMTDPIIPVIQELLGQYPTVDAKILLSETRRACWPKVDAIYDGQNAAKHDLLIWSDSDVIVPPGYVLKMVEALSEPGISLVTTPQVDCLANGFASAFKAVGNTADVGSYVMIYNLLVRRKGVAFGHSIGYRRSEFSEIAEEAWDRLNRRFADDLELPRAFTRNGKQVVHRNIVCPVRYQNKTLREVFAQQERFALCQRTVTGRAGYFLGLALFPQIWATAALVTTRFSQDAVLLWLSIWCVRSSIAFCAEKLLTGTTQMTRRWFWTIPLWDLCHVYFMGYALFQNEVRLGGRTYKFETLNHLSRVESGPASSESRLISNAGPIGTHAKN